MASQYRTPPATASTQEGRGRQRDCSSRRIRKNRIFLKAGMVRSNAGSRWCRPTLSRSR